VVYKDPHCGKTGVIPGRRNASDSGMESGKVFPESNPTVENSDNDRISK